MATFSNAGIQNNITWASNTPNITNFTDYDIEQGILYRSELVSSQVNGALQMLSTAARWNQFGGGYWSPNSTYDAGNTCRMAVMIGNKYHISEFMATKQTINVCPVNTAVVTTNFFSSGYMYLIVNTDLTQIRDNINDGWVLIDYYASYIEDLINNFKTNIAQQLETTKNEIVRKLTPSWYNFGSIGGGSWDLNLGIGNDLYNCFSVTLTAAVSFRNIITTGSTEKSGLLVILNGGNYLNSMFTDSRCIFTFDVPFPVFPSNTSGGTQYLALPYYYVPSMNKIFFTRV